MELADGDVLKMLVGAYNKMFDGDSDTTNNPISGNGASLQQQRRMYSPTDAAMREAKLAERHRYRG